MRRKERGAVLVLVLGAVAILSILAVNLASRASVERMKATRVSRERAYRRTFDSGVEVAKGLLVEPECEEWDFWGERWNEDVRFSLAPKERGILRVFDESGKINVTGNIPTERLAEMLGRLFNYLERYGAGDPERWKTRSLKVIARLGLGEREDDAPSPAPLVTLDGLREAGLTREEVFGDKGLARYLTCFGDGKINLNSALRPVLYSLHEEFDETVVEAIAAHRGDPEGGPGIYTPFEDPKDLELVEGIVEHATVDGRTRQIRNLFSKVSKDVTVESRCFGVRVRATVNNRHREAWSFFETSRLTRPGKGTHRALKRLAFEEILP